MFIRAVKKRRSKDSKTFIQYTLAQTSRINGKVKQRSILYLGSNEILADKANRSIILNILKSKIFGQSLLLPQEVPKSLEILALSYYEKYCLKYKHTETVATIPPVPKKAEFHNIDIKGLEISDVRNFGAENLCKQIIDKLTLGNIFSSLGFNERRVKIALISIIARAVYTSSEHKTAQILNQNSSLLEQFSHDENISAKQLYSISDKLFEHKDAIDKLLYARIKTIFNLEDKLVIFDISNTYFETRKSSSQLAKYGRSKEKRKDCPLVVFTGVINAEGFIRHSRIYEGNKADSTTLTDMISDLQAHSTSTQQTIVLDAGIATDDNLIEISAAGLEYVCVSRKRLKDYPVEIEDEKVIKLTNREKSKVELKIFTPQGFDDTWMYVRSDDKRKKEESIHEKLKQRFEEKLKTIEASFSKKRGTKKISKVWERIGRAKQEHKNISPQYKIEVEEKNGIAISLTATKVTTAEQKDKQSGIYFIRTNKKNTNESDLWTIYNTIREVESTFRCLKSDLNIRPVFHQKDSRIEAHIYLTILSYQLVNTIRHMLKQNGIRNDWSNIVRLMNTQTIQTVVLPTDKKIIHLRKSSTPISAVDEIYSATNTKNSTPPIKTNVVYH